MERYVNKKDSEKYAIKSTYKLVDAFLFIYLFILVMNGSFFF